MTCASFRTAYAAAATSSENGNAHLHSCSACRAWYEGEQARACGIDPARHPCAHIAYRIAWSCKPHEDPWECPDATLVYSPRFDEYGIPVRDGGQSYVHISHCPWCGIRLPESKRERWIAELETRGIEDPFLSNEIPEAYLDDKWWRHR